MLMQQMQAKKKKPAIEPSVAQPIYIVNPSAAVPRTHTPQPYIALPDLHSLAYDQKLDYLFTRLAHRPEEQEQQLPSNTMLLNY